MSGPVALIVNPVATKASRALRAEVVRALAPHGLEWSLVTEGPGARHMPMADAPATLAGLVAAYLARLELTLLGA